MALHHLDRNGYWNGQREDFGLEHFGHDGELGQLLQLDLVLEVVLEVVRFGVTQERCAEHHR